MIRNIFAILTAVLGVIHCCFTPAFFNSLTVEAVCFIGAGLVFVFLGFLNLAISKTKLGFSLCFAANIISIIYALLFVVVLKEFQAVIALILALGLTIFSLKYRRS